MNKSTHLKKYLVMLLVLLVANMGYSQKIGTYKNGQLQGAFKIKLKPTLVADPAGLKSSTVNGYSTVGIQAIDYLNIQYQAVTMKRLFPYSAKHDHKHQKHGLHLWYTVEVESEAEIDQVIRAYGDLSEIEQAEPFYEKSLVPYNITPAGTETFNSSAASSPFDDPRFDEQWHYHNTENNPGTPGADINLLKAWETQVGHPDVIVAVIDQGVDYRHEDLAANMWVNEAELNGTPGEDSDGNGYIDDIYGFDFVNMEGDVKPLNHGTHVAGTVAAVNNNGIGVAGVAGGSGNNDGVRIMSCMIMSDSGAGSAEAAFVYAADNGAVIAQNSWGWNEPDIYEQSILDAIDYFIEEAGQYDNSPMTGGVVIFAAGNNGHEGNYWPGCYDKVIAVASHGKDNEVVPYSNYGTWLDISAPGGNVDNGQSNGILSTMPGNEYGFYDGTSMACPHVSGVAGLIVSEYKGADFDKDMLVSRLLGGVNVIDTMQVNLNYQGKVGLGAIDAHLALQEDNGIAPDKINDFNDAGVSGTFAYFKWTVPVDGDDENPRYFKLYYSTETNTENWTDNAEQIRINSTANAGDQFSYELKSLEPNTTYNVAVSAIDRWGNESELSDVINVTTNNGPQISLDNQVLNFDIDVNTDTLSHQQMTITNTGEGLLKWDIVTRHVENIDTYTTIEPRKLYDVNTLNVTMPQVESNAVSAGAMVSPYAQKPEDRYMHYFDADLLLQTLAAVGESNTDYPNSSATHFKIFNPIGWNLTGVEVGFYFNELPKEPLYAEVYEGSDLRTARLIHSQAFSVSNEGVSFEAIDFDKQMFFEEGDEFFLVVHVPPGHKYPFLASQGLTLASADYSYFSTDQGASWDLLKDVYYDYTKVWDVIALNNLVELEPYVKVTPTSGYLNVDESKMVDLTINAAKLINGNYKTNIEVFGKGYENNWETLLLDFNVTGQKHQLQSDDIVNFGNVFIGENATQSITISNIGLGAFGNNANALSIDIADADFELLGSMPNVINGERSTTLSFVFAPSKEGAINSKVTISDPDGQSHSFILYGAGTKPAKAVITPEVREFPDLNLGDDFSGEFTLTNDGDYPLRYYIPKFADGSNMPDFDPNSIHKFGYIGSHNESVNEQPAFEWEDIQYTGEDITDHFRLDGSVIFKDVLLGFSFPYFGNEYDTCYITTQGAVALAKNGWFNAKPAGYKSTAQPSKLISAWGMPFDLNLGGKIYYQKFPGKFILQYQDVIHGSYYYDDNIVGGIGWLDENISFQIVLHQNGDIDFNYKDLGDVLGTRNLGFNRASTLIMIEDNDVDDRLVLNGYGSKGTHPFIEGVFPATGKQIYFKNPGLGVLTNVTNPYGTVNVGESVSISYTGSTQELYVADFEERINVVSNDPLNNPVAHTISMNITTGGEANFTFEPQVLDFGNVFQGATKSIMLRVGNDGKAIGRFSTMEFSNGVFAIDGYMPVELRPGTFSEYTITVVADELGEKTDVLTFTAENGQTYQLDVSCTVVEAPVISASHNEIIQSLNHGDTESVTVSINNTGLNTMQVTPVGNEWMHVLPSSVTSNGVEVDYTYTIEHDLNSPYFTKTDVVETGTKLETPGDILDPSTFWMTVPMPFEVSFYGQQYDTLYLGITGIITFVPDQETREWGPGYFIPNEAGVNTYLAPMFGFNGLSNPNYYPLSGIYTKAYDDKFVVRYQDMGSNGGGKPISVEIWMFKNGTIKYFYEMEEEGLAYIILNGSLVGIENQDGTKGVQVSAKTTGVIKDGTIVTFLPNETYEVQAQSTRDFDVHLSAQSIYGGQYYDELEFQNNTPSDPGFKIPVTLDVTGKDSIVVNDTLQLGEIMIIDHDNEGYSSPYKRFDYGFTLANNGTRNLLISNVRLQSGINSAVVMGDDNKFGSASAEDGWVDISRKRINYTLKPLARESFNLRITPMQEALVNDTILVYCDVEVGVIKIPVSAVFTLPPDVNIQSEGVHVYANTNEHEESRTFVIDNINGSMDLTYEIGMVFERNLTPVLTNSQSILKSGRMPSGDVSKIEKADVTNLKDLKSTTEEIDLNRVLQYEQSTGSAGNVGFGSNNISFTSATGFYAPEDGFNLSHVMTWYAWGDMLDTYVNIRILGGSEDYFECQELYTQRYHHVADAGSSAGEMVTIELDEPLYFFPGEKFFIEFKYDEFIAYPQGTFNGEEEVYQRFYFGDGTDMFETTEQGYGTMGWIVRAGEIEAGGNAWSILNSEEIGEISAGEEQILNLDFNSAYAKQGVNLAKLIIRTNDPYTPELELPVSLTRNKGPQYKDGFEVNYNIYETDTLNYQLIVTDEEGDDFTISIDEDVPYFSYTITDNVVDIEFIPDFNGAGKHEFNVSGTDSHGNATVFSLKVDVADLNRAPVESTVIGEQVFAIETEEAYKIDLSYYIEDPDGDAVTFSIDFEQNEAAEILSTDAVLAFAPLKPGYVYVKVTATDELGATLETGFPVFIEHRVGIDDVDSDVIALYPNPVKENLYISLSGVEVNNYSITDTKGSVVLSDEINHLSDYAINVEHLMPGVYVLMLETKSSVLIKKFTKQ
ncbi:MAG: S8 family serine peptidase [Bacteroidales bacterium]|nr:S8 family serine peptidase [Bacteroidales bacterium]